MISNFPRKWGNLPRLCAANLNHHQPSELGYLDHLTPLLRKFRSDFHVAQEKANLRGNDHPRTSVGPSPSACNYSNRKFCAPSLWLWREPAKVILPELQ